MRIEEFNELLTTAIDKVIVLGIQKGYFKKENKEILKNKLLQVLENGVDTDIMGTAIYGVYSSSQKKLYYNAKVFKDKREALIYILHEMKHALDDNELSIGFQLKNQKQKGVGMNEGATQRFATDIAEEILEEKIPKIKQSSLGIALSTDLDEYQIQDKMNELFCKALGISRAEFLRIQNEEDLDAMNALKQRFNEFADFDAFEKALDGIYAIQEETWVDANGNVLEQEAEPTQNQTARAKELIRRCQSQIIQFVERSNPEGLSQIKKEIIMIDREIDLNISYQNDYMKYQEFILQGIDLGESAIVYVSGTEGVPFEDELIGIRAILNSGQTFSSTMWLRKGDEYKKVEVTFNGEGVIKVSEEKPVTSLEEISEAIESSETFGNPEEYLRILELQGKKDEAIKVRQQYEYYMNNKDKMPKVSEQLQEEVDAIYNWAESGEFQTLDGRIIWSGEEQVQDIPEVDGSIIWNGKTIMSGFLQDEFGRIQLDIPEDIIKEIDLAIKNGELVLTEAQRKTLLDVKQNLMRRQVSEGDFKSIAEENIVEKDKVYDALKLANQVPENGDNIQGQGD